MCFQYSKSNFRKRLNTFDTLYTHIRVVRHCRDQVLNKSLQGPRHQVVVMVIQAFVVLFLGLIDILVISIRPIHHWKGWSLRHFVLLKDIKKV